MVPITQLEYLDEKGRSPFAIWRASLDDVALAKVTVAVRRLSFGNVSNVKGIGQGVNELKIAPVIASILGGTAQRL